MFSQFKENIHHEGNNNELAISNQSIITSVTNRILFYIIIYNIII